jgi:protein translocase subunit secF
MPLTELFNLSINVTLPRTIVTSVTTLIAIGGMYAFGGDVIRSFTAAMIIGVIIGTYSTVFIATPLVLWAGYKRPSDRTEPDGGARASA